MSAPLFDELFVANLSPETTEADIKELFEPHAVVKECWVGQKKALKSAANTSFSSVRVTSHNEAAAAKKALHGATFKDRTLVVKWAANQRLLWVGSLPDSVTNEALEAGFSQFGSIARARVVSDASNSLSRRYGFVLFEEKRDAQKALSKCQEGALLFGNSLEPIRVDWARIEDVYEGYSDAIAASRKRGGDAGAAVTAHMAATGTQEHMVAMRMKQLQAQYEQTKQQLKAQMAAALNNANAGQGNMAPPPNQQFMGGMGPGMVAPPMVPPPGMGMGPMAPLNPPMGGMGMGMGVGQGGMSKGMAESFNSVPPPSKSQMRMHDRPERFNPLPPKNVPPAMAAPPAAAPAPEPASGGLRFVKAGSLSVVGPSVAAGGPTDMQFEVPATNSQASDTAAVQNGAAGEAGSTEVATIPGAKAPGAPDHRGIGFTGPAQSTQGTSGSNIAGPRPPPLPATPYGTSSSSAGFQAQGNPNMGNVPNYPPPASMGANFSNTGYNMGMQGMGAMQQPPMQGMGMGQQSYGNYAAPGVQSGYTAAMPGAGMGAGMGGGMQQMGMGQFGAAQPMQGAMSGNMQPAMSGYGAPAAFNGGYTASGQQPQMY